LPIGLSWIGPAWSEGKLIQYAYAFEQATKAGVRPGSSERRVAGA